MPACSTSCANRLQQQTATADVIKVISRRHSISRSYSNARPVGGATVRGLTTVAINVSKGSIFQLTATYGYTPEFYDYMKGTRFEPGRGTVAGRVVA